jgi:uncharacterized protein
MFEVFRDLIAPLRSADRRDAWILMTAVVSMTVFVAVSQGGAHPVFAKLFGGLFASGQLPASDYHWWKILFFHVVVLVAFGVVPILVVKGELRGDLADYGLALGDWKWGLKFLAIWCVIMGPGTYISSLDPSFQAEYPLARVDLIGAGPMFLVVWAFVYVLYYFGWEFLFRGFLQLGLAPRLGVFPAMMMQTIPSTIIHIGKPIGETSSAILGGLVLGAAALRTRSILWPLLAHWYIGFLMEVFASMHRAV